MSVVSTTVDGIPALFAARDDGGYAGGLVFRVGWADETLAVRGLTHLVQHLALDGVSTSDVHHHGETHATYTHVHASGTADEVVRVLGGVCAALADLPVGRVEVEKEVLRAEARGRSTGAAGEAVRYGAVGHGLAAYPELGLPGIDADLTTMWAAEAFTRENAVLWISGERIPDGLELRLPSGRRQPLPPVTDRVAGGPAFVVEDEDVVRVSGVLPRSAAALVLTEVLRRASFADLRRREPLAVGVTVTHEVRDGEHAVVRLVAECLPERRGAVAGAVVDTLARLRWGTVPAAELEESRAAVLATLGDARSTCDRLLVERAVDTLLGARPTDPAVLAAEVRAVGPDELRAAAETFHASALAQVPAPGLEWAGWASVPSGSPTAVEGREYHARGGRDTVLVVGEDGVSVRSGGTVSTVRFADVAVMLAFADGGRSLIGTDGVHVGIEPSVLGLGDEVLAGVDAAVDPARVVHRPARTADVVAQETESPAADLPASPEHEVRPHEVSVRADARRLVAGVLGGLLAVAVFFSLLTAFAHLAVALVVGCLLVGVLAYVSGRVLRTRSAP